MSTLSKNVKRGDKNESLPIKCEQLQPSHSKNRVPLLKKRAKGTGSVYERKRNGKLIGYKADYWIPASGGGKSRKKRVTKVFSCLKFNTTEEAKDAALKHLTEITTLSSTKRASSKPKTCSTPSTERDESLAIASSTKSKPGSSASDEPMELTLPTETQTQARSHFTNPDDSEGTISATKSDDLLDSCNTAPSFSINTAQSPKLQKNLLTTMYQLTDKLIYCLSLYNDEKTKRSLINNLPTKHANEAIMSLHYNTVSNRQLETQELVELFYAIKKEYEKLLTSKCSDIRDELGLLFTAFESIASKPKDDLIRELNETSQLP